jgi:3-oxoacyl-[acyl-carrier protein] reductase
MKIDLQDKTVLITGGSRGIGASCVKLFIESGANVAFTYNTNETASDKILTQFSDANILSVKVDVNSESEIKNCTESVVSRFGRIDILVNNAGVWEESNVEEMSIEEWNRTINTNLTGSFLFVKFVVSHMKQNKFGRIINISSTAGQRGEPQHSHYAASKGGIISFTKSLAVELAPYGITTNCVAPGWVYTDMSNDVILEESKAQQLKDYIPLGRAAYPDEIAGPVLFLASQLADHINGEILNVNGGSELCG